MVEEFQKIYLVGVGTGVAWAFVFVLISSYNGDAISRRDVKSIVVLSVVWPISLSVLVLLWVYAAILWPIERIREAKWVD